MKNKKVLAIAALLLVFGMIGIGFSQPDSLALAEEDAVVETFLPMVAEKEKNVVRVRARGARLLSSDTSSWQNILDGKTLFHFDETDMFDVLLMLEEYPPPTPDWYALARTYLEFDVSDIQDKDNVAGLQLSLPLCDTQYPNWTVGITVHQGTWPSETVIISDTFTVYWDAWNKKVVGENRTDPVVGEVYVVPLSLDLLQAEDGLIRLVLRAIGEETFSGESKQTCFNGEEIYLEMWQ